MEIIRESLEIYKNNFTKILLITLFFTVPIGLLYTFLMHYVEEPLAVFLVPVWPTLIKIFFGVLTFSLVQIPFIALVLNDSRSGMVSFRRIWSPLLEHGYSIYFLSVVAALFISLGSLLFIIPGIIFLVFTLGIAQAALIDKMVWFKGIKQSFLFAKQHFFRLMLLLVVFAIIDFLVSYTISFGFMLLSNSFFILNLILIFFSGLIMPLFIIIISLLYMDWTDFDYMNTEELSI